MLSILNRRITIEIGTESTNDLGTPVLTYSVLKKTYASVSHISGNTRNDDAGRYASTEVDFNVRFDSAINYKCRILYSGQYYRIFHILPIGVKDGLKIKTTLFEDE
jgi:head-tail adaptor